MQISLPANMYMYLEYGRINKRSDKMIVDYISKNKLKSVEISPDGVYLNKNITEIKSMYNSDIIGYQCLRLYVDQNLGNEAEIEDNFELIWKAYGECGYDGNILTDSIETVMNFWHSKNLSNFETYLKEHPILYTDGNYYGVEEEDRNEMAQQLGIYNLKVQSGLTPDGIKWHTKKKACKLLTLEEFSNLLFAVEAYALKYYELMQSRKESIYECDNKADIFSIPITYEEITEG